ncbi:pre-mRNA cleavage complex 2 protein Pcf11 isoform X1 [Girardinichthys multiradiatus]|uniref:pre-mRNA cleavage complex 2 protein Pcf11 isoform X1 n=1 Tax=Girardinichthys multiradiatus TaxID=208333 RepID=UPI001FACC341|nr:pre-mRNA cleavage complex 2 protein Pcf11 isoform X1 [Girardinichthys multiradiatus]
MDCLLLRGNGIGPAAVGLSGSLSWKMEDQAAREDACREYQSSLEDLTFNSKPHINMLTILAEENTQFAKDIVAIIEAQISKAPAAEKLPVLYLVDSIVKNVGGEYLAVFAKNLIPSFICVFEKVDENTRKSLFKLRSTWDEVFPLKKLYALDVRVNSLDPAWPIKPLPPNINSSIHVNPRFLKQSEEKASPQPVPAKPAPVAPAPQVAPATTPSSLTQEQLIRQQLLAKQKQLLELQQKKIELELEQTKAQLVGQGGLVMPPSSTVPTPAESSTAQRPGNQNPPGIRPWIPPQPPTDSKSSTRDPRLNRSGPPGLPHLKEHPTAKRESPHPPGGPVVTTEKKVLEKSPRLDKARTPRKDVLEDKLKSKSPSPLAKGLQSKSKQAEVENPKSIEAIKKDPRLKKRLQEKTGEVKDDELKEKKRCIDKKEREEASRRPELLRSNKAKSVNGLMAKHDYMESSDKADLKAGGNGRRKRTCSRSRSRSPAVSPKRKDRRSPKSHTRSSSLSPSHKPGKPRRVRGDDPQHGKLGREDRPAPKKIQSESRRPKRPQEDRQSRESHSPRGHDSGGKETKESLHRWRSGWEENKHMKLPEDSHTKSGPPRHKPHSTPTRPSTPRNQKIRLSVDANLQIPEVLNSASKKDLLRRASKRLESGEISQEDFLNMAHQIKHFFQYQEEKQQRSENWEDPGDFSIKKQSLLNTPHEAMDAAELSYYEHKSKLRKTQVNHRVTGDDGQETSEDGGEIRQGEKLGGSRSAGHPSLHAYSRPLQDRTGERRSKERDEPRPPLAPMVEEYNHGKEFPKLKSLPGLRFRRRVDPGESSEREWTSPLTERQLYDEREEHKSGYDAPRRYCPADTRRQDGPSPSTGAHRSSPAPVGLEAPAPRFERERLSPLHQKDLADMSPVPRFESPNSEHSDEGPIDVPPPHPPHEGGHPPSRYSGPSHMGPSRPHHPGWYEGGGPGRFEEPQFDGPHHPGPGRFDGGEPPHHNLSERTESSGPHEGLRMVMRGGGDGIGPLEGPPQGPNRFGGPIGQQQPVRFEGQMGGPGHLEGPLQRFDGPGHFNNMGPGPMGFQQQRSLRFEGPNNQMGPIRFDGPSRFEGPGPGPRFDVPGGPHQPGPPRFDYPPGQQGPPRFPPQPNLQLPMQPMAPPIYDNPITPQQNFGMAPQRFPEPMNPQFPPGPNMLPAGNFSMQPAPFSQPGPGPFYNPAAPAIGMQQPVNMMGNMNQSFLPQNPVPFGQQTPQVAPQENHFGQVDVNDLLSKLISNGIIKPPSQTDSSQTASETSSTVPAPAGPVEEEEEEEPEVEEEEDLPDLTSFSVENMKQRYESVVTKLYSGNQCCLCSMRFTTTQTDMYADHLDWHFRQNHAGKVASKKVTHRRWYYSLTDWIEFEEIADLEERAKSQFFEKENEEEVQKNQAAAKEKEFQSVRATKDQVGELCEICQEPFETYWVEEEEDWFLKNAVRVDDKNFHPACFEDYKNTSSYLDVTPSPSRLLTEHPLGALVKTEEEEEEVTSCEVKQEVQSDPCCVAQQEEPGSTAQEVSADSAQSEDKA